jgi:hypothetical protein
VVVVAAVAKVATVAVVAAAVAVAIVGEMTRAARRLLLALAALGSPAFAQNDAERAIAEPAAWQEHEVGAGVRLRQRAFVRLFAGPQFLSVLDVQCAASTRFDLVAPGERRWTSTMGQQAGALAAINGGFFAIESTGLSIGLLRLDGQMVVPAKADQGSVGLSREGQLQLAVRPAGDWPEVHDGLGAGPMLLVGGAIQDHGARQRSIRHPRTAVGVRPDGSVLWLVVDGRAKEAVGMTFEETATVLRALGCCDGLNLDGGGSSTLWVAERGVCNHPCDDKRIDAAGERRVANALLLFAPAVVVVDDRFAERRGGGWQIDGSMSRTTNPDARAVFRAGLPFAGQYRVRVLGESAAPVRIELYGGAVVAAALPADCGEATFPAGLPAYVTVAAAGGGVAVDAVRFEQIAAR